MDMMGGGANKKAQAEAARQSADARRRQGKANTEAQREQQMAERGGRGSRARLRGRGLTTFSGLKSIMGG